MILSHKHYAYVDPDHDQIRLYRHLARGTEIHEKIERELAKKSQDQRTDFVMLFVLPRHSFSGTLDWTPLLSSSNPFKEDPTSPSSFVLRTKM